MLRRKLPIADLLFGVQMVGGFVVCSTQFFRLIETTKGQLLSMFLIMEGYLCLNLMLASAAHRAGPSRVTKQTLVTYQIWLLLIGSNIAAIFLNGDYRWSHNDTLTVAYVIIGILIVFLVMSLRKVGLQDPMFRGLLSMVMKALPQFLMIPEIMEQGGAGLPGAAVMVGNLTILIRVGQIGFAIRESGRDRNRLWLCASEVVNEVSWATLSVVWLVWWLRS